MELTSIASQVVPLEPLAVAVPEAARLLGVSPALAYELIARGHLNAISLGRRLVVPVASLRDLVGSPHGRRSRSGARAEA